VSVFSILVVTQQTFCFYFTILLMFFFLLLALGEKKWSDPSQANLFENVCDMSKLQFFTLL